MIEKQLWCVAMGLVSWQLRLPRLARVLAFASLMACCASAIYCAPNTYFVPDCNGTATCVPCDEGEFCPGGPQPAPLPCPAGFSCTGGSLKACALGTYSIEGVSTCTSCPEGSACPYTDRAVVTPCATGYFSATNATKCTPCPAGFACASTTGTGNPVECGAGEYTTADDPRSTCIPCPAGSYCASKTQGPVRCPVGYYSSGGSATACELCAPGYQCANPAAPAVCLAGTFSQNGSVACTPCAAGFLCTGTGNTESAPVAGACPEGQYCEQGATTSTPCPAGRYSNRTGLGAESECTECPSRYYCAASTVTPVECPLGYYCPQGTSSGTQFPCRAGSVGNVTLLAAQSECASCPSGSFCVEASTAPQTCPAGYYCPADTELATQFPCPGGRYSSTAGLSLASSCSPCPAGHFCPPGSTSPQACVAGTFNAYGNSSLVDACIKCTAGFACPTQALDSPAVSCVEGHYCPAGTVNANDLPCPPGTYSSSTSLTHGSQCDTCPEGKACMWGTTGESGSTPPVACASGHFCPAGTQFPTQHRCPPGTYAPETNLTTETECTVCPAGSYCQGAEATITGVCAQGHFCPTGTNASTLFPCPTGRYTTQTNLTASSECDECPIGHYCPAPGGVVTPVPCNAGTYTNVTLTESAGAGTDRRADFLEAVPNTETSYPSCTTCPAGFTCAGTGTVTPSVCSAGTYALSGSDSCATCEAGHYCPHDGVSRALMFTSYKCPAGLYCPAGVSVVPTTGSHACPVGAFCEEGTATPTKCPPGTYQPFTSKTGAGDCYECPAGSFCLEGVSDVSGTCDVGHFCPNMSSGNRQEPCPASTYRNTTGATEAADCDVCPLAHYCPIATVEPLLCPQGHYCAGASSVPTPCPRGRYSNGTGLTNVDQCVMCDAGRFCDGLGLSQTSGPCDPGFFCVSGAYTSTPTDGVTGDLCPRGGYCLLGSTSPKSCPAGTFNNVTGSRDETDCQSCLPGFYCQDAANPGPQGPCEAGWYCEGGAISPRQIPSPAGYYTTSGASAPIPCDAGTYNPAPNATECLPCPASFYCPNQTTIEYVPCPVGHYCPVGSHTPVPCPKGTFSNAVQLYNVSQCTTCLPGQHCPTNGQTSPAGPCEPGYFCTEGSYLATPTLVSFGGICPSGFFCGSGTSMPEPCPAGTYQPTTNAKDASACLPCPAGSHCNAAGRSSPSGSCAAGFVCGVGTNTSTPVATPCPVAHRCPEGSNEAQPCEAGTYQNRTQQSVCEVCPLGYVCDQAVAQPSVCPAGFYCPAGSPARGQPCPLGTFSPAVGLSNVEQCLPCTPGSYCGETNLTGPSDTCLPGYFCPSSSSSPQGAETANGTTVVASRPCPAGFYCEGGSSGAEPCPVGTYSSAATRSSLSDCVPCDAGWFCNSTGLALPSGECAAGFFCERGSNTSRPESGKCPVARRCPTGSAEPLGCSAGTYQNAEGQATCLECPAGHYCTANTSDYAAFPCPMGHYCPPATRFATEFACPPGSFNAQTMRVDLASGCETCPAGSFCGPLPARVAVSGACDAGFVCLGNASTARPADNRTGFACVPGTFCPEGSTTAKPCTPGQYCENHQLGAPTANCSAGFYCPVGAVSPTQRTCPAGHYCETGASEPVPCGTGTYAPSTGNTGPGACLPCAQGFFCNGTALATPTAKCEAGKYCPAGTVTPTLNCTVGHYCPEQSHVPVPCSPGSFQNLPGQATCQTCLQGFVCEQLGVVSPAPCPLGFYCPEGSATAQACPSGTFNNVTGRTAEAQCIDCTPGYWCANASAEPTAKCSAGYVCVGGDSSPTPASGLCPAGRYCPEGSITPVACPAGKFAPSAGATNETACLPCARGTFCQGIGATNASASELCSAGFICLGGASVSTPTDGVTGRACPPGTFCVQGTLAEETCRPGTYNPNAGQGACLPCPAGFMCPSDAMTNATDCPAGGYCPEGTSVPRACPAGTFSTRTGLVNVTQCTPCTPGRYCSSANSTETTGPCAPGFLCAAGGASSPTPTGLECPVGHVCLEGATVPTPCDAGTFNPIRGGDNKLADCVPCTAGSYCATQGLSAPSGPCEARFYCPAGSTTNSTHLCPPGAACPTGSASPSWCAAGTFQDVMGQSTCKLCPLGSYCPANSSIPIPCPSGSFCPSGSGAPTRCLPGTFGVTPSLGNASECSSCPAGSYCTNGSITGTCDAGYLCSGGAGSPRPRDSPCPAGHYCLAGATVPTPCGNQTLRTTPGAATVTECLPCPAGYICYEGNPVPDACDAGHYCLRNGSRFECPIGTYNADVGAANISACLPCPAGFWCNRPGTEQFSQFPCPTRQYCPSFATADPIWCPGGTYRDTVGAASVSDCTPCPAGYFCRNASDVYVACLPGTYCPSGSSAPTPCSAGSWCGDRSPAPVPCAPGYYCPDGTNQLLCNRSGEFCPAQSAASSHCPLGYASRATNNRSSLEAACVRCPPGQYQDDASQPSCELCAAGYLCTGGAWRARPENATYGGRPCPAGHYCPSGATQALACPPGTMNPSAAQGNISSCLLCPPGAYNDIVGQPRCYECGASSSSMPGATRCSCIGRNRAYQVSVQTCVCHPGYTGSADGTDDCEPIVYDRCSSSQVRDFTGSCVNAERGNCESQCATGSGDFVSSLGVCECAGTPTLDSVCDAACRNSAPSFVFRPAPETIGELIVTYNGTTTVIDLGQFPFGYSGNVSCLSASGCPMLNMIVGGGGMAGAYGTGSALDAFVASAMSTMSVSDEPVVQPRFEVMSRKLGRRLLQASAPTSTTTPTVSPAIVCLELGEGLLFDIGGAQESYPVYVKDNLFNTNPNFDYGRFEELAAEAKRNGSSLQMFAFAFNDPGVYVFADNVDREKLTVVVVQQLQTQCPTDGRILPFTAANLVMMGVTQNDDIILSPDWVLIGIMGSIIVVIMGGFVAGVYYFQHRGWGSGYSGKAAYRKEALDEGQDLWTFSSKGSVTQVQRTSNGPQPIGGAPSRKEKDKEKEGEDVALIESAEVARSDVASTADGMGDDDGSVVSLGPDGKPIQEMREDLDMEGFDFHALYQKLEAQHQSIENFSVNQDTELQEFYEKMSQETEHLKSVLAVKLQIQMESSGDGFLEACTRIVMGELLARKSFERLEKRNEAEFHKLLHDTKVTIQALRDYDVFAVTQRTRQALALIDRIMQNVASERNRRRAFGSYVDIVGDKIIRRLVEHDVEESRIMDKYLDALEEFASIVGMDPEAGGLLFQMARAEREYAAVLEGLRDAGTLNDQVRKMEQVKHDTLMLALCREVLSEIDKLLNIRFGRIYPALRNLEAASLRTRQKVREMLDARKAELRANKGANRLFRGINPDLAKVLTGLLGQKDGLHLDPDSKEYVPNIMFDPLAPVNVAGGRAPSRAAYAASDAAAGPGGGDTFTDAMFSASPLKSSSPDDDKKRRDDYADADNSGGAAAAKEETAAERIDRTVVDHEEERRVEEYKDKLASVRADLDTAHDDAKDDALLAIGEAKEAIVGNANEDELTDAQKRHLRELERKQETIIGALDTAAKAQVAATAAMMEVQSKEEEEAQRRVEESARLLAETLERVKAVEEEKATIDDEDAKDDDTLIREMEEKLRKKREAQREKRIKKLEEKRKELVSKAEEEGRSVETVLAAHDEELKALDKHLEAEQQRQRKALEDKIEQKKRRRAKKKRELEARLERERAELKKVEAKHKVDTVIHELAVKQSATAGDLTRKGSLADLVEAAAGETDDGAEGAQVDEESQRKVEELRKIEQRERDIDRAIEKEQRHDARDLRKEEERERRALEERLHKSKEEQREKKRREIEERRRQLELKAEADGQDVANVMAEHDDELKALDKQLELEQERQRKALEDKIAQKKAAKANRLRRKKMEMLKDGTKNKEVLERELRRKTEMAEIRKVLATIDESQRRSAAKPIIEKVLRPRFQLALVALVKKEYEERAEFIRNTLMSENLDRAAVEKRANAALDGKQREAHKSLKRSQADDVKSMFKELYLDEKFDGLEWIAQDDEEALEAYQAARDKKMALERQKNQLKLQAVQEELERKKQEEKERLEREIREREREQEDEIARMAAAAEEKAKVVDQKILQEKFKLKQQQLEKMQHIGDEQRQRIMEQHRQELIQLEKALEMERQRQKANLIKIASERAARKRQIAIKRRQKVARALAKRKKIAKVTAALQQKKKKQRNKEAEGDDDDDDQDESKDDGIVDYVDSDDDDGEYDARDGHVALLVDGGGRDRDSAKALMRKLTKLEKMVKALSEATLSIRDKLHVDPMDAKLGHHRAGDEDDLKEPEVCPAETLSNGHFLVYRFGAALLEVLHERGVGTPLLPSVDASGEHRKSPSPASLLVAEGLPKPSATMHCGYKHSFAYDARTCTLFVRREWLEKPGEFLFLLMHALAHAGTLQWDDRHALFTAHLNACLQQICGAFFFNRSGVKPPVSERLLRARRERERKRKEEKKEDDDDAAAADEKEPAKLERQLSYKDQEGKVLHESSRDGIALNLGARQRSLSQLDERAKVEGTVGVQQLSQQRAIRDVIDFKHNLALVDSFTPHALAAKLHHYSVFQHSSMLRSFLEEHELEINDQDYDLEFVESEQHGWDVITGASAVQQNMYPVGLDQQGIMDLSDDLNREFIAVVGDMVSLSKRVASLDGKPDRAEEADRVRFQLGLLEKQKKDIADRLEAVQLEMDAWDGV